jgi:hypothetical protein
MTNPAQGSSRTRTVALVVGLLLLVALIMGTCRFSRREKSPPITALVATPHAAGQSAAAPVLEPAVVPPSPSPASKLPKEKPIAQSAGTSADQPPPITAPPAPEAILPPFVPLYPNSTSIKIATTHNGKSVHGDYEFSTSDPPDAGGKFYATKMIAGGLVVVANVAGSNQDGPTFTLIAEDAAAGKTLALTAVIESGRTRGAITFAAK